jgi:hypothetical protein
LSGCARVASTLLPVLAVAARSGGVGVGADVSRRDIKPNAGSIGVWVSHSSKILVTTGTSGIVDATGALPAPETALVAFSKILDRGGVLNALGTGGVTGALGATGALVAFGIAAATDALGSGGISITLRAAGASETSCASDL